MHIIDGKSLAQKIHSEIRQDIDALAHKPTLGVLLVGTDAASHIYVSLKEKAAHEAGILTDIRRLPIDCTDQEILKIISEWNADANISGILLQLPLPPGHDTNALIQSIDVHKDVDGFHPANIKKLLSGEGKIVSPVHEGILRLIASTGIDPRQKRTILIANSDIFAIPLEYILRRAGFLVERMSAESLNAELLAKADVIISACGKPFFISAGMITDGAILIDVGTTYLPNGKVVGDFDLPSFEKSECYITPVPGGVGPMTVALLLKNILQLATSNT